MLPTARNSLCQFSNDCDQNFEVVAYSVVEGHVGSLCSRFSSHS